MWKLHGLIIVKIGFNIRNDLHQECNKKHARKIEKFRLFMSLSHQNHMFLYWRGFDDLGADFKWLGADFAVSKSTVL